MRYVVIHMPDEVQRRPWVVAETPDEDLAHDEIATMQDLVLSREEASLDPEYRDAVDAWDQGDDSARRAWRARRQLQAIAARQAEQTA